MTERARARLRPSVRRNVTDDQSGGETPPFGQPGAFLGVQFTVPGPPISTNATYRTTHGGRWYKDHAAAAWQSKVTMMARRSMCGALPTPDHVEGWITFFCDSERPDVDGPVKGLLDRLGGTKARPGPVLVNDRQVRRYHVEKQVDRANPRTEVTVRAWSPVVVPVDWHAAWEQPTEGEGV